MQPPSPALAAVLGPWSLGMTLARRCGLDSATPPVAALPGQPFDTVRQRLREFYQKPSAKRGRNRKDFAVSACFAPLLRWVLSFWSHQRLAQALDVTNLGNRFHALCVSVWCGGIGIPVAWKILAGSQPEVWHPPWGHLPLACTLLTCWDEGHTEPWLLLTDLPPAAGNSCW